MQATSTTIQAVTSSYSVAYQELQRINNSVLQHFTISYTSVPGTHEFVHHINVPGQPPELLGRVYIDGPVQMS
jgi:hypothetical protein